MISLIINTKTIESKIYKKFTNFLIQKGKKEYVLNQLTVTLFKLKKAYKINYAKLIWLLLKKLHTSIEIKTIKKKGRVHNIPVPINYGRQIYLASKWLAIGIRSNLIRTSLSNKLYSELNLLFKTTSQSLSHQAKIKNARAVCAHKSQIHYRW